MQAAEATYGGVGVEERVFTRGNRVVLVREQVSEDSCITRVGKWLRKLSLAPVIIGISGDKELSEPLSRSANFLLGLQLCKCWPKSCYVTSNRCKKFQFLSAAVFGALEAFLSAAVFGALEAFLSVRSSAFRHLPPLCHLEILQRVRIFFSLALKAGGAQ